MLVEAVEPALNRKQGDATGFERLEFYQKEDPEIARKKEKLLTSEILTKFQNSLVT